MFEKLASFDPCPFLRRDYVEDVLCFTNVTSLLGYHLRFRLVILKLSYACNDEMPYRLVTVNMIPM